jgi:hypothetical protein
MYIGVRACVRSCVCVCLCLSVCVLYVEQKAEPEVWDPFASPAQQQQQQQVKFLQVSIQ